MRRQLSGDGEILLAGELLAGDDVPQAELGLEPSVALPRHAAGDQRLRVDRLPVLEVRRHVEVGDLLDEGGRVDRREQAGRAQIVGDDLVDAGADSPSAGAPARNRRSRSASAAKLPCVDVELRLAEPARRQRRARGSGRAASRQMTPAAMSGRRSIRREIHLDRSSASMSVRSARQRARTGLPSKTGVEVLPFVDSFAHGRIIGLALQDRRAARFPPRPATAGSAANVAAPASPRACRRCFNVILTSTSVAGRRARSADSSSARPACSRSARPTVATVAAAPGRSLPSAAFGFSVAPVAACRCGSRLSSSAAICDRIELRLRPSARASSRRLRLAFCLLLRRPASWLRLLSSASAIGSTLRLRLLFLGFGSSASASARLDGLRRLGLLLDRLLRSGFGGSAAASVVGPRSPASCRRPCRRRPRPAWPRRSSRPAASALPSCRSSCPA